MYGGLSVSFHEWECVAPCNRHDESVDGSPSSLTITSYVRLAAKAAPSFRPPRNSPCTVLASWRPSRSQQQPFNNLHLATMPLPGSTLPSDINQQLHPTSELVALNCSDTRLATGLLHNYRIDINHFIDLILLSPAWQASGGTRGGGVQRNH